MSTGVTNYLAVELDPGVRPQTPVVLPHADSKLTRQAVTEQPSMQHQRAMQAPCAQYVPTRRNLDPAEILPSPEELLRAYASDLRRAPRLAAQTPNAAKAQFHRNNGEPREGAKQEPSFLVGKAPVSTQDAENGRQASTTRVSR